MLLGKLVSLIVHSRSTLYLSLFMYTKNGCFIWLCYVVVLYGWYEKSILLLIPNKKVVC